MLCHVICKTMETSILNVNSNRFPGPVIIGTFKKWAPMPFKKWQDHAGCVLQVKIKIRLKFFTKVDSQFSLSLCPKYSCISASRQRNLKIKLG